MANQLFPLAREQFATGVLDWTDPGLDIRVVLLPSAWTANFDTVVYLSDIPSGARIATSEPIESRTATAGFCNGTPADFGFLSDTRLIAKAVMYVDTEDEATSVLLAYYDEFVGEPFTPTGVRYFLYPDAEFGGFFRI